MCGPIMYDMVLTVMGETMANRYLKGGFTVINTFFIPVRPDSSPDDPKSMTVYIMGKPRILIVEDSEPITQVWTEPNIEVSDPQVKKSEIKKDRSKKVVPIVVPHNRPTAGIAGIREL